MIALLNETKSLGSQLDPLESFGPILVGLDDGDSVSPGMMLSDSLCASVSVGNGVAADD